MSDISVLKWIYKSCGKRNKEIFTLILLNVVNAVSVTTFAMVSKTVMDSAQNGNRDELVKNVVLLVALLAVQLLTSITSMFMRYTGV